MSIPYPDELRNLRYRFEVLTIGRQIRFNDGLRRDVSASATRLCTLLQAVLAKPEDHQLDHTWVTNALKVLWLLRIFIRNYEQRHGAQRYHKFIELYNLKHSLMALLCLLPGPDCYSWQVGRATHMADALSLLFKHADDRLPHLHVIWPLRHVPIPVALVIAARCGGWPPPEVLALPDWEL